MNEYQVGGSLSVDASSYVTRKADNQLIEALLRGEFCYVFNCRQMGKSSLRVRAKNYLQQRGYACVSIDMTNIGSQTISPLQWYKGIASELWRGLQLTKKVKLKAWWEEHEDLSLVQQLNLFITDVVLTNVEAEKIFIFIDEIDSVISLDFSTDDFFALIRYFYNARAENKDFERISFALFGVATPNDLIQDNTRTPFNIGTAIELTGFTIDEATPLLSGLETECNNAQTILKQILKWTGGQPFLTQKLCTIAKTNIENKNDCFTLKETEWVQNLVYERVIINWEEQDEPEHLKTIRDRLLVNEALASRLLYLAEKILKNGFIVTDNSSEQTYLLLSNLVVKRGGKLFYRNLIYQKIFDLNWIHQQQKRLRPFGKEVQYWLASNRQDKSRLLRGKALQEAQIWAKINSISQQEYQFLTASQEQEQEQIRLSLEFERLKEIETRLKKERKLARLQRFLLFAVGGGLVISSVLGITAYTNYRQAKMSAIVAKTNEIKAHTTSANSLFDSGNLFESLLHAIMGIEQIQNSTQLGKLLRENSNLALKQAVYNVVQKNVFSGHLDILHGISYSLDGELIVSSSSDNTVKIWQNDGKLLKTLPDHQDTVLDVEFSPDGELIASSGEDNLIKLWTREGEFIKDLQGHQGSIYQVAFSPTEDIIASASEDKTVRLWNSSKGKLLNVLLGHDREVLAVNFSRDGKLIATGDRQGVVKIWTKKGDLLRSFTAHEAPVRAIDFSPQGDNIVTGGDDNTAKIWTKEGKLSKILRGYDAPVTDVQFSPDGKIIATSSWDKTIKLWHFDGTLHSDLKGHQGRVWRLDWSPDGSTIATAGWDNIVKLWQIKDPLVKTFYGHTNAILSVVFHPQGELIASASDDRTVKLWHKDGRIMTDFKEHTGEVYEISFSQDGELIASGSLDSTIKLWQTNGKVLTTATGHTAPILDVVFFDDGKFASASFDRTIRLWQLQTQSDRLIATQKKKIFAHEAGITDIDVSEDEKLLVSVSHDGYLKLWNNNLTLVRSITADEIGLMSVDISPDQQIIATGGREHTVKIWDINGKLIDTLEDHQAIILDVEFSPDGELIASASADRTIKIWTKKGKLLTTLEGHQGRVWNVSFSPDGKSLASASEDKTVKVWNLERILQLDEYEYGCHWLRDYLRTNSQINEEEKKLCN